MSTGVNVISMCLYGTDPKYQRGAIANAEIFNDVYRGWRLRIYLDSRIGSGVRDRLRALGVDLRVLPNPGGTFPMFQRFWPAADKNIHHVIVRDSDSLLNVREKAAVDEWIASGKTFHVMRDHPHHAQWPMLGGMWGCKGGALPHIVKDIIGFGRWSQKLDDMRFLAEKVWPHAQADMMHHSSVPTPHPDAKPFPEHPPYKGYVGEIKF